MGYAPWVVADASASHDGQASHDAGMLVIERFIGKGQILTVSELLSKTSVNTGG
jgi:nicotinamidase-related amidase